MKNFVQEGNSLDFVAPEGGVTGGVFYATPIPHVAAKTAAEDEEYAGWTEGVYEFPAETHGSTQAIAQGGPVYWDESEARATKTAAGNILMGAAVAAKASTDATVKVKLWPRGVLPGTAIADISLAAVAGVDGTGSNAASKADVDTRFGTIQTKINAIIAALEGDGTVAG